MKTFSRVALLAAASSVLATPTPTEELVARSSSTSLTAITVSGNGMAAPKYPVDKNLG